MASKTITLSIDPVLMDRFRKKCRVEDIKYSVRISELIKADLSGGIANSSIELLLSKVQTSLDEVKEMAAITAPVAEPEKQGDNF